MVPHQPKPDYGDTKDYIQRLKVITGLKRDIEIAEFIGVPNSTIATWKTHNRINFESMVAVHLATGASIQYLALGQGEPFPKGSESPVTSSISSNLNEFDVLSIENGRLKKSKSISIDTNTLAAFGLKPESLSVVENGDDTLYVDLTEITPTNGTYLVAMDEAVGFYHLQRLPKQKVAIQFDSITREFELEDLHILGRVKMCMKRH